MGKEKNTMILIMVNFEAGCGTNTLVLSMSLSVHNCLTVPRLICPLNVSMAFDSTHALLHHCVDKAKYYAQFDSVTTASALLLIRV